MKTEAEFDWDPLKELLNISKHRVDFTTACRVFIDPKRKIFTDEEHSADEIRFFLYW